MRHQCASASASSAAKKRQDGSFSSPAASHGSPSSSTARSNRTSTDMPQRRASVSGDAVVAPSVIFVSSEILARADAEQPAPRSFKSSSSSSSVAHMFSGSPGGGRDSSSAWGNPLAAADSWLGFQQYRTAVEAADGVLMGYNAFCKSLVKKRKKIAAVLAEFLKGTLKIFANEQFR